MIWIFFCYFSNITLLDSHLTFRNYKKEFKKNILDCFTNLWVSAFSLVGLINSLNSPIELKQYNYFPLYFLAFGAIYQMINYGSFLDKIFHLMASMVLLIFSTISSSFSYIICFFCLIGFGFPAFFENITQALSQTNYLTKNTAHKMCKYLHMYVRIPLIVSYICISYMSLLVKCG